MLKRQRLIVPLTLQKLSAQSGVSSSHLGRIERGERFPSARVLRRLANPLGFTESELFSQAGFLSSKPPTSDSQDEYKAGRLDPYVSALLSKESLDTQRAVIAILSVLKTMAKGNDAEIGFADYIRRKYPEVEEDIITMMKDLLDHPPRHERPANKTNDTNNDDKDQSF
jgi:transcriptional regulator with XRE-family HTH domain